MTLVVRPGAFEYGFVFCVKMAFSPATEVVFELTYEELPGGVLDFCLNLDVFYVWILKLALDDFSCSEPDDARTL